jgi:hypothetical protein
MKIRSDLAISTDDDPSGTPKGMVLPSLTSVLLSSGADS